MPDHVCAGRARRGRGGRTRGSPRELRKQPCALSCYLGSHNGGPLLERDPLLAEIVGRLIEAYRPERIYLFGSKARGDEGPDSDYDLMVVVPDEAPPERRRSRLAYEVLRGTRTATDVVVCTRSWFDARLHLRASFPSTIVREGKLLHAA